MGHIVTSPLPRFSSLAEAQAYAMPRYAADVEAGLVFVEFDFGPAVVFRDGTVRQAEYIARGDGFTWVVAA